MAWPSNSARTKNWGTEILTDTDLESQLDILHQYFVDCLNGTTGHGHTGGTNDGPKLDIAIALKISSQAQGDIIYASSSSVFTRLGAGTAGQALTTGGASANPAWGGMTTQGDIEYHNGTTRTRLGAGTSGQVLKTNGASANPSWVTIYSGWGAKVSKSAGTLYQAATDGTVNIVGTANSGGLDMTFYTDSNSSPSTVLGHIQFGNNTPSITQSICVPINKNDYYQLVNGSGIVNSYYFTPQGI